MNAGEYHLPFDRLRRNALFAGGAGLVLSLIELVLNPTIFFHSYLLAFVFWLGWPLGCLALLMMHHLTGGGWGFLIRRVLEAGTRTMWLLAVLYVPLLLGLSHIYAWARPGATSDPVLQQKHFYLNVPFFLGRSVVYFGAWLLIAFLLNRWSSEQDRSGDQKWVDRLESLSAPGIVIYGFTITFAMVDLVMSLEPTWYSTIYGMIFMVAQALVAMSFVVLITRRISEGEPLATLATPVRFNDLGNLLLTFVMLWAYFSFSQFLLIWSGNLPEEISWYMSRAHGSWAALAVVLILFHFAVPFMLLLSRRVKRHSALNLVAGMLLVLTLFDIFWLVVPSFEPSALRVHWTDITLVIGMGGIWLWSFLGELAGRPLLPEHDPRLVEVLEHVQER
jgi:hypothetical protein